MCKQKLCPGCFKYVPAHVPKCTNNGCSHVFTDSTETVNTATVGRSYPAGVDPDDWFRSADSTGEGPPRRYVM